MEFLRDNSQAIIYTLPICWGIYEFRKFNSTISSYLPVIQDFLQVMRTTNQYVEDLKPIILNLNEKVNDITNDEDGKSHIQQIQELIPLFTDLTKKVNGLADGDESMFLVRQIQVLVPIISNLNEKVNSLADGDQSVFPVVTDIHNLTQKINTIFTRLYGPLPSVSDV